MSIYPNYQLNNPIHRGEIFIADLDGTGHEIYGVRPVVVIQNDIGNKHSSTIIIAPITSSEAVYKRNIPTNMVIDRDKYELEYEHQVILLNQIKTIDKTRLHKKIAKLDTDDLKRLDEFIGLSLGMNEKQEVKGMNEIQKIEKDGQRLLTTQQLAEFYETEPVKLQQNYANNKERYQSRIHYFVILHGEESYSKFSNSPYQTQPIYLWTKKGAFLHAKSLGTDKAWEVYEMLVNTYFQAKELIPQTPIEALLLAVQNMAAQEKRINQLEDSQKTIKETIVYRPDHWRDDINKMFDRVARANDNRFRDMRAESYRILEERAGCDLEKRLDNLKERKREAGATATEVNKTNKIEVIEGDQKLREIYTAIIKELVIKYVA